jgi:hypothetical protein
VGRMVSCRAFGGAVPVGMWCAVCFEAGARDVSLEQVRCGGSTKEFRGVWVLFLQVHVVQCLKRAAYM